MEGPAREVPDDTVGLLEIQDHNGVIQRSATERTWVETVAGDAPAGRAATELRGGGLVGKAGSCLAEGGTEVGRRLRCTTSSVFCRSNVMQLMSGFVSYRALCKCIQSPARSTVGYDTLRLT